MKAFPVAGKFASILFGSLLLVACSGSETNDSAAAEAAAAEAAAAEQAAAESAAKEAQAQAEAAAAAEQQQLQDAAMSAGTVFYFDFDSSSLTDAPGWQSMPTSLFC